MHADLRYVYNMINPTIDHPQITKNRWYKPAPNGRFNYGVPFHHSDLGMKSPF